MVDEILILGSFDGETQGVFSKLGGQCPPYSFAVRPAFLPCP